METVAVYWEPIIRTYGFEVREGFTLAQLPLSSPGTDTLGQWAALQDDADAELVMAAAAHHADTTLALWVVLGGDAAAALRQQAPSHTTLIHPVDVVHFHGPHFGDRYGIANAALSALDQSGVQLLLMGCTGASVYLAVPGGTGAQAVLGLRAAFTTPDAAPPTGDPP